MFVDELDRCKPSYAVKLLERVKHYFANDRITFVFSINSEQLQHTISGYYGAGFNAGKYLDRFFDLRVSLPQIDMKKYFYSLDFYDNDNTYYELIVKAIIEEYHFEMREVSRYLSMIRLATDYKRISELYFPFPERKAHRLVLSVIVPYLIGVRLADIGKYNKLVHGLDSSDMVEFFIKHEEVHRAFYELLNDGEYFNTSGEKSPNENLAKKIVEVYDALFILHMTIISLKLI